MTSIDRSKPRGAAVAHGIATQPAQEPAVDRRTPLERVLRLGFVLTLVVFLGAGFVLVGIQAVQLAAGDGSGAADVSERLGPPTFAVATACGLFAFALEYLRHGGREGA
jgi:hypothetical protein